MPYGTLKIGNKQIKIKNYELTIKDVKYPIIDGLLQLILEKEPNQ